ncbi:MAG: DNA mismatch repair endonuclease MutL [Bacillota bacterium]
MPKIKVLDEITANQIAAGEVVERPASVVKELIENSFDAGSTKIYIEIKGGGLELIKVTDNGCGMDEIDVETAFQRHATSKISSLKDIEKIFSLGFRGEALPSIASVSKITMITRPPDEISGTRLEIEGGRLLSKSPEGCPPGTTFSVRDLFFNTPARLKYMKTKSTEAGQVTEIASRLAIARPDVGIKLEIDGRNVFQTPGTGNVIDSLSAVYGPEIARNMLTLERQDYGIALKGYIGPPTLSRSTKRHISVIINGRYVRHYLINTAVIEGYGTLLQQGRFPVALIFIDLDPGVLDVNVHPSKMVVRVSGESNLFNLVKRTVMSTLRTERIIPGFISDMTVNVANEEPPVIKNFEIKEQIPVKKFDFNHRNESSYNYSERIREQDRKGSRIMHEATPSYLLPFESTDSGEDHQLFDNFYPIGFLPPTYIIAGGPGGLVIIDHHAAHERILYERFLKILSKIDIDTQVLLVPLVLHLSPVEYKAAEENIDYFSSFGIKADLLGSGTLVIREIPARIPHYHIEDIIRDILEDTGRRLRREDTIKNLAASSACREAVKSGTRSSIDEAWAIIEQLKKADNPFSCPHGRPTMINISEQELKNRFKRT